MRSRARPRRRPRLVRALAAVSAAVLLGWVAAAWYFSDVLYDDAFRVTPPPATPTPAIEVLAATDSSIALAAGEDVPTEVVAPGTWGLWWDGGYGTLDAIRAESAAQVTRALSVVEGAVPDEGTLTDVDKYVYGDSPDQVLGLAWEGVSITTALGAQDAWFVPAADGADVGAGGATTWAILVHGKGSDRDEMLRMLATVHEQGLPAVVVTYRGDRDQPVDPSGIYRYGATEWADLDAAVAYALDRGATDLVLAGASTGAALIGSWFDHGENTDAASALVFDAPNADVERTFAYGASQRTVPGTPWHIPPALSWSAFRIAEARFPVDFAEIDYSDTLAAVEVPVLVFHGTGDLTVPVDATRELVAAREAAGLDTTYVETTSGEHVGSYNHDPTAYDDALGAFLDRLAEQRGPAGRG